MRSAMITQLELPNIPLPLLIAVGIVQNLAILALIVWLGLKLSRSLGLRTPLLESWVIRSDVRGKSDTRAIQTLTQLVGVLAASGSVLKLGCREREAPLSNSMFLINTSLQRGEEGLGKNLRSRFNGFWLKNR